MAKWPPNPFGMSDEELALAQGAPPMAPPWEPQTIEMEPEVIPQQAPPQEMSFEPEPIPRSAPPSPPWEQQEGLPPPANAAPAPQAPPWALQDVGTAGAQGFAGGGAIPAPEPPPEVDAISGGGPTGMGQPEKGARLGDLQRQTAGGAPFQPDEMGQMSQLTRDRFASEAQKQSERSGVMKQANANDEAMLANRQLMERRNQQMIAAKREQLEADMDAYARGDIDPSRWQKRTSMGEKFSLVFAAFLSGMINPRGPNEVLDHIGKEIDRDIEAQRADMMRRGNVLNMKQNAFAQYVQQLGSEEAAYEKLRGDYMGLAANKLAAINQSYAPQEAQMMGKQVELQMRQEAKIAAYNAAVKQRDAELEQANKDADRAMDKYKTDMADVANQRSTGLGYAGLANQRELKRMDIEADKVKEERKVKAEQQGRAIYNPRTGQQVGELREGVLAERADKVRAGLPKFMRLKEKYAEYKRFMADHGNSYSALSDAELRVARQMWGEIATTVKDVKQTGAWDNGSAKLVAFMVPDPARIDAFDPMTWAEGLSREAFSNYGPALDQAMATIDADIDADLNTHGYIQYDGGTMSNLWLNPDNQLTDGKGPAVRPSQTKPLSGGTTSPDTGKPLDAPRLGR